VLGVRVRDDLAWGLPASVPVDVDGLLDRVGLGGFANRETATLSGGELQRLAVASALARRPALLISDESTAMVDEEGRAQLLALLRSLPEQEGLAVAHVTHHRAESALADRVIALDGGRVVERPRPSDTAPGSRFDRRVTRAASPLLLLRDVGHVYGRGTPWAHRALAGIDLRIDRGESLLVVGHNGSGKSTLAWILGGLVVPSEGEARLDGEPVWQAVGQVGVAFQHARLQLLRPTVSAEVAAASGATPQAAWQALTEVGFDAHAIGMRRVDELSGGQARRVVLAAALAGRPRALVLDEPFAGLDEKARADLAAALVRMRADHDLTLIVVSHDHDLPPGLVDREIELAGGRITYDGPGRASERDAARGSAP
jgi:energy-coupling factor transport system ATP-binding protein